MEEWMEDLTRYFHRNTDRKRGLLGLDVYYDEQETARVVSFFDSPDLRELNGGAIAFNGETYAFQRYFEYNDTYDKKPVEATADEARDSGIYEDAVGYVLGKKRSEFDSLLCQTRVGRTARHLKLSDAVKTI